MSDADLPTRVSQLEAKLARSERRSLALFVALAAVSATALFRSLAPAPDRLRFGDVTLDGDGLSIAGATRARPDGSNDPVSVSLTRDGLRVTRGTDQARLTATDGAELSLEHGNDSTIWLGSGTGAPTHPMLDMRERGGQLVVLVDDLASAVNLFAGTGRDRATASLTAIGGDHPRGTLFVDPNGSCCTTDAAAKPAPPPRGTRP